MENSKALPNMGVIICANCDKEIDTVDTNKMVTFYGICQSAACLFGERKNQFELERINKYGK